MDTNKKNELEDKEKSETNNQSTGDLEEKKKGEIKKRYSLVQKMLLVVFLITFILSGLKIIKWYMDTSHSEDEYKNLAKQVTGEEKKNKKASIIDFESLKNINPDIVGWIKIEGTPVDYPIVQGRDNEYYLKRNFYNEYSVAGTIFADYRNNKDLSDKNVVLFGHNMKNGSMFATLLNINNKKIENDITVNVYGQQKELTFKVFSSYVTEPDNYPIDTSISNSNYDEFINKIMEKSEVDYGIDPKGSNQVLTLSTCNNTGKKRVIVHAKLDNVEIYDQEN